VSQKRQSGAAVQVTGRCGHPIDVDILLVHDKANKAKQDHARGLLCPACHRLAFIRDKLPALMRRLKQNAETLARHDYTGPQGDIVIRLVRVGVWTASLADGSSGTSSHPAAAMMLASAENMRRTLAANGIDGDAA
jgi:hypothetical protein